VVLFLSLLFFAAFVLTSPFLGRLFCGWVCPAATLQELTAEARGLRYRKPLRYWVKYLIWLPWFGLLVYLVFSAESLRLDPLFATVQGVSISNPAAYGVYFAVILVFLVLGLIRRRLGCRSICSMAPFMAIGQSCGNRCRIPRVHIRARPEACIDCGRCVDVCPKAVLSYSLARVSDGGDVRGSRASSPSSS
jgi:polyferredoxin